MPDSVVTSTWREKAGPTSNYRRLIMSVPGLVGTFPDDHDKRRSVAWYPELNGIPPLLGAATRRPIRGSRPTSARVQLSLLRSIRHRDGSSTPDDVVRQHLPSNLMDNHHYP
jgi:hypothetical protein